MRKVCSSFATGPRQNDGMFYEFRTYSLKPSKMNEFLENFKKNVHLRTAHSELVGYWSVEFGGRINKVFHIWKYENFAHRTAVRKALAKDKEWQEQFLIPNLALIDKQESEITYLVPWCKLEKPPKEGVYELATFQMKPGGPALWGDAFKRAINAHVDRGYTRLVGVFHTEYGTLNSGTCLLWRFHVLWWNESADSRAAGRHQSHEDPRVVAAVRESVNYLVSQQNMLLTPASFSPLK
ncbi:protein NipSnap homolog 3A isoform X6 [Ictidomys tridecemlineatus]|uniref:protein NipSnap homolog 3A isoform X3 n=1 Tax=Ictidomys tridecemlineatus TaxID=43179 RepID=UPI001A9F7D35|nr:protein NipSnap homolog 3A isoform X3 [Ictidomys tridecemlineatus]